MASQTFQFGIKVEKVVSGRTGAARGWGVFQGEDPTPCEVKATKQAAIRCAERLERTAAATAASLRIRQEHTRPNACDETDPRFLMLNALKVFTLDPNIRTFLEETDPQALKQAREAIAAFENREIPTQGA